VTQALRTVTATRYVTPLREGGSLPALVEADDDGLYVVKFRGAGQGAKALVAELLAGGLARALGLPVPELVLVELDPELAGAEPDPEIRALLRASAGLNVGLDFLPGALAFTPGAGFVPDPELAAAVVWLDALATNVDRNPRNPNLLVWHRRLWLIDQGAALYQQHGDGELVAAADRPFPLIGEHVLLPYAGPIDAVDPELAARLPRPLLGALAAAVPEAWLDRPGEIYAEHLARRLAAPRAFAAEAEDARRRA